MRIPLLLLALGVGPALSAQGGAETPFSVSGLPIRSTRGELVSVQASKEGVELTVSGESPVVLRVAGMPWAEFPTKGSIQIDTMVIPDGPQYLVTFLSPEGKTVGTLGVRRRLRSSVLNGWTLAPEPGTANLATLTGPGGEVVKVHRGTPVALKADGVSWRFVLRGLFISTNQDLPTTFDYSLFLEE